MEEKKECKHEWVKYPTYKKCGICGEIILGEEMLFCQGIIIEENEEEKEEDQVDKETEDL